MADDLKVRARRIHPGWIVAAVAFLALVGAAGFRAAPSVLMLPLEDEFGWSRSELATAVSVNLLLYGLTAPFAAALMEKFGIRRVVMAALVFALVNSPCVASWAGFGVVLRRFLGRPGALRAFNMTMALLLVVTLVWTFVQH